MFCCHHSLWSEGHTVGVFIVSSRNDVVKWRGWKLHLCLEWTSNEATSYFCLFPSIALTAWRVICCYSLQSLMFSPVGREKYVLHGSVDIVGLHLCAHPVQCVPKSLLISSVSLHVLLLWNSKIHWTDWAASGEELLHLTYRWQTSYRDFPIVSTTLAMTVFLKCKAGWKSRWMPTQRKVRDSLQRCNTAHTSVSCVLL